MLRQPVHPVEVAEAVDRVLEKTVRGGLAPRLQIMEIVQYLFPVEFQGTTVEMEGDMRQAARIIGKGTLALSR